ncbi:hypothetical protein ACFC08_17785 [Streptomyces sp. NPDC056112]|uniref:hypothetical protein n=1 Tax=Streptomyces sp. NPDC056112 TaxID=3345715 RepID=UPI0035D6F7E0
MATRDELFQRAVAALRQGNKLLAAGADESHPGYAAVMPALHAATAAGFTDAEIYAAATSPQ